MSATAPSAHDNQRVNGVLVPPEDQAGLVGRLVDLVILLALEADFDAAEEDALPIGQLRGERDGFVRVWRKSARNAISAPLA